MYTIEEITIPTSLDEPEAGDFIASVHIRNTIETLAYGTDEFAFTPHEILPRWHDAHSPKQLFGIRDTDGTLVARSVYETQPDSTTAWLVVEVLPGARNRGMGTALADHIEAYATEQGRTNQLIYCVSPDAEGARVDAASGFGSVPVQNPEVQFLLDRGYSLEQVERASRLPLPVDTDVFDAQLAETTPADYAVHTWIDRTPPEWLDSVAMLLTRMSTDAPSAGLEEPEDVGTADRVVEHEERMSSSPRTWLYAGVEHLDSNALVGFTTLSVSPDVGRSISQEDTIVLHEHRGRRLGMVLKLANLLHLERERPGHPSVITFNAEENRHMLAVNEQVGFVPIGYEGAWRHDLS